MIHCGYSEYVICSANMHISTHSIPQEFYIPVESSSIHYLKTKLCVGCTKGFEIVDLETLDTQALLDPSDSSLEFVQKRDDVKPMAIYRIESDFLLCYDSEYASCEGGGMQTHIFQNSHSTSTRADGVHGISS